MRTHYDDDIFYISSLIKTLQTGLSLELDAEFFMDKTIEDILFIDITLSRILLSLKANQYLINRTEHLRSLLRTNKMFIDLVETAEKGNPSLFTAMESFLPRLRKSKHIHHEETSEIQEIIEGPIVEQDAEEGVVSATEINFLLAPDQEDPQH